MRPAAPAEQQGCHGGRIECLASCHGLPRWAVIPAATRGHLRPDNHAAWRGPKPVNRNLSTGLRAAKNSMLRGIGHSKACFTSRGGVAHLPRRWHGGSGRPVGRRGEPARAGLKPARRDTSGYVSTIMRCGKCNLWSHLDTLIVHQRSRLWQWKTCNFLTGHVFALDCAHEDRFHLPDRFVQSKPEREGGGIGRRARFRSWSRKGCGFESRLSHGRQAGGQAGSPARACRRRVGQGDCYFPAASTAAGRPPGARPRSRWKLMTDT